MARGEDVASSSLSHSYGSAEVQELSELFKRLFKVQSVLLRVNQEYIASASQDDRYRTEPPFKLQGSYRNMAKLTEKVVAAMNDAELERLIDDHYTGEAQTLTKGAEQNLLKLAELRGRLTPEQASRWQEIKDSFLRVQRMGGSDEDPVARVTGTLSGLDLQLQGIREALVAASAANDARSNGDAGLLSLAENLSKLGRPRLEVRMEAQQSAGLLQLFGEQTMLLKQTLQALGNGNGERATAQKLSELQVALTRIGEQLALGAGNTRRVDVELEANGPSNLYRPLSSPDILTGGGIFAATYEKPPPLGAAVRVSLRFPNGANCELGGRVEWLRDDLGEGAPAGFGVRFSDVSAAAGELILAYAEAREPLLWDD
jgi:hypothetical protein